MNSTLKLAMAKASEPPEEAQEQLDLELIDRFAILEKLRADLDVGLKELDAGLGRPIEIEDVIRRGKDRLARG